MKKGWKIFGIICASLAGLGIVLCVVGFTIGATDKDVRSALRKGARFVRDKDFYDEIDQTDLQVTSSMDLPSTKEINVEVDKMLVEVVPTEDKKIRMENLTTEEVQLIASEDEESVEIKTTGKINKATDGGKLILYIPKNLQLPEISIHVGEGKINLNGVQAKELDLELERGEINAFDFEVEELSVSCGLSVANVRGIVQKNVDLDCGAGVINFETKGTQTDYNYEIEAGIGEIRLGGQKFSGIAVEKTINNHAEKEMGVDCGAGKVNVKFIQ